MADLIERKRRRRRKEVLPGSSASLVEPYDHVGRSDIVSVVVDEAQYQEQPLPFSCTRLPEQQALDNHLLLKSNSNVHQHTSNRRCSRRRRTQTLLEASAICERLPRLSLNMFFLLFTVAFSLLIMTTNLLLLVNATGVNFLNLNGRQQQQQQMNSNGNSVIPSSVPTSGKGKYKTIYACEDRLLKMECEFGSKINLIRANYGRFSITQCNEQGQLDLSTDCMSPITFRIMQDRCQDKQRCQVNATSSLFGDKCPKTRKYLEVHFQCHPDVVDMVNLRNSSSITLPSPSNPHLLYQQSPVASVTSGTSPILPPNNPIGATAGATSLMNPILHSTKQQPPSSYIPSNSNFDENSSNLPASQPVQLQLPPRQQQQQQQPQLKQFPVMNSEIISYNALPDSRSIFNTNPSESMMKLSEPVIVTFKHSGTENMSNPRCVLWDVPSQRWTEKGSQLIITNLTHTTCAFDQASSYLLIMDWLTLHPPISQINPALIHDQQQQQLPPATQTQASPVPPFDSPAPNILEQTPIVLNQFQQQWNQQPQQPQQPPSSVMKFFSMFGYLIVIVFVAVAFITIAFIASTMRSSAGAALKSLGNFTAFGGQKHKGRRADGSLHNKDLLVINNQNGHQFLYAPASATKLNSSASTHILGGSVASQQHQNTLHQLQQQQLYSGNGTLSNLSGAGGQSNNYYYGLMGFNNLFQQQQQQSQMQHHLSQHHLNQQQQQQQQAHQLQQTLPAPTSYHPQANKSTISTESANSTPSSSGVESGSTGIQQQSQHTHSSQQQQQTCLVMNGDYNLLGQPSLANYSHQQALLSGAGPTLTLNTHYSSGASPSSIPAANQQQRLVVASQQQLAAHHANGTLREHIYECVDDDKPYNGRMLLPSNLLSSDNQFNSNTLSQAMQQQQHPNLSRTMTLSSRILQNAIQQQQLQPLQQSQMSKRLFSHPAIVRDNQATKTSTVCSKLAQVTPQRATAINKFQHDVMAIYNGNETTTTTATTSAANSINCYSTRQDLNDVNGSNKLSTDC